MTPLRVCLIAAEVAPFARTGGLGDVAGALARYLWEAGHDVRLFFPLYSLIQEAGWEFDRPRRLQELSVRLGGRSIPFRLASTRLPGTDLQVWAVDCPQLYHRPGLYTQDEDEPLRFALLCRGALEACRRMRWSPEIVHGNDWHCGLLPLYLESHYSWETLFVAARSLLTIHNAAYQGVFSSAVLEELDLGGRPGDFDREDLDGGRVNFLKTGILHADMLSTVSPTHARELLTPEQGHGLEALLRARREDLVGILNGVDYEVWNPAADPHLAHSYDRERLEFKEVNRLALLEELGLPPTSEAPVCGLVSRLVAQKGLELCLEVLPPLLEAGRLLFVALGTGDPDLERRLSELEASFPEAARFVPRFDEPLSHRIEAGCDLFLMPSLFEPCGLNQMYSQRYGTLPVVRRTGGLADSVEAFDPGTGEGTGFVFEAFDAGALLEALELALATYGNRDLWRRLQRSAMNRDFSWERRIGDYVSLYQRLLS